MVGCGWQRWVYNHCKIWCGGSAFPPCEGFAEDSVLGSVQGDVGDVNFKVFVGIGLPSVTVQCEGFPLGGNGGVSDEVGEGVRTSRLVGWEWVGGMGWWTRVGKVEVKL